MKQELVQDFQLRITQASKSELVVIMYEIILADIDCARQADKEGDIETLVKEVKHAKRFLNELMATLDYSVGLSFELLSLYSFINKELVKAEIKKITEPLDNVEEVIQPLHQAFLEISKKDFSGPVMRNTQQLYAGLTYGRGTLNETFIDPNERNRGFVV